MKSVDKKAVWLGLKTACWKVVLLELLMADQRVDALVEMMVDLLAEMMVETLVD